MTTEQLKTVEKFADLIQLMYDTNILTPDEYNNLVSIANTLQYKKELKK